MRKQKKYHYIYKTTNLLNGKYYIGMHSTDNMKDGYLGSGKRLRYSINKHGADNHKREILEFVDTREELKSREEEIVTLNEIAKVDCMNLRVGGIGGFKDEEHRIKAQEAGRISMINRINNDDEYKKIFQNTGSKNLKEAYRNNKIKTGKDACDWNGRKHSEETKQKMSKSGMGEANSQFGKCWITNESDSKKIYRGDAIPEGWRLGRKMK